MTDILTVRNNYNNLDVIVKVSAERKHVVKPGETYAVDDLSFGRNNSMVNRVERKSRFFWRETWMIL